MACISFRSTLFEVSSGNSSYGGVGAFPPLCCPCRSCWEGVYVGFVVAVWDLLVLGMLWFDPFSLWFVALSLLAMWIVVTGGCCRLWRDCQSGLGSNACGLGFLFWIGLISNIYVWAMVGLIVLFAQLFEMKIIHDKNLIVI